MSNHQKRLNYSGAENVAILRDHFVEGLLQEHVQLKKSQWGPLTRRWIPHDTRDQIVDSVNRWTCCKAARRQVMRIVIACWKKHGEHELSNDSRKNLQRLEKPRDNHLTLTYPPVSLRRTGLG
jgi:hypothetical protein